MALVPSFLHARAIPTMETLFPQGFGQSHWTTLPSASGAGALPLNDDTLNPIKVIKELGINYTTGPDERPAIRVFHPEGSYTLNSDPRGGMSFYTHGPDQSKIRGNAQLSNAREATFGYSVYFPEDFEFVSGGKLPGFFGGNSNDESYTCSGGREDTVCFSTRLMWRAEGAGEVYAYFPSFDKPGFESNKALCDVASNHCDPAYGISLGRGNFTFPRGEWTTVAQLVRLNDPGQANGIVELWANGEKVIHAQGIKLVDESATGRIRGLQVQSFFGGNSPEWASPIDQSLFLGDFSVAVTSNYDSPPVPAKPRGNGTTGPTNGTTGGSGSNDDDKDAAFGLSATSKRAFIWTACALALTAATVVF